MGYIYFYPFIYLPYLGFIYANMTTQTLVITLPFIFQYNKFATYPPEIRAWDRRVGGSISASMLWSTVYVLNLDLLSPYDVAVAYISPSSFIKGIICISIHISLQERLILR